MAAIVSGNSLGLSLTSLGTLGQRGVLGQAGQGRNGEQAYVNVSNGNLVLQDFDDRLVGRGQDAVTVRTYNSQGQLTDDNGDNWSVGVYAQQISVSGTLGSVGSTVSRTGRDGAQSVYSWDAASSRYLSHDGGGAYDNISVVSGQLKWVDAGTGQSELYSASNGRLLSSSDLSGNTLSYAYNAAGLLASVTDANGEATFYDYSGSNLTQVRTTYVGDDGSAKTLTRVHYAYDTSNRLATITVDLSPTDNSVADGNTYVTHYTYDGASTRVAGITQSDGTSIGFTYVQVGSSFRVASVTDGLGQITRYAYDTVNHRTTVTDPLGLVTRYDYDANGQLTGIIAPAVAGVSATTQFVYSATGDVQRIIDGLGQVTLMQYDSAGNQIGQADAAGNTIARTYDLNNQLLTDSVYLVPNQAGVNAAALTTRYVYDGANRDLLRFVISPAGRVTEYRYDAYGQRVASLQYAATEYNVDALARTAVPTEATMISWAGGQDQSAVLRADMSYDARGQLSSATEWSAVSATGVGVADGTQSVTRYFYDQAGQLLKTIATTGGVSLYSYDGLGRQMSSTDALNHITLTQYDDANNKTTTTLVNGLATTSAYDRAGRLIAVAQSGPAAQALGTTQYTYDADNRLRITQDPTGVRSYFLYDQDGRKVADINALGVLTEYVYDQGNQLVHSIAYAVPISVAALFNADGSLSNATLASVRPQAILGADLHHGYVYDAAGRLTQTIGVNGAVINTRYDGASRISGATQYANLLATVAPGTPVASANDRISTRFYDNDGLLIGTQDAEGYLTEYRYNAAGELVSSTAYASAAPLAASNALLSSVRPASSANDQITHYLLNGKGQVAGVVDAEGYLTETVYDDNGNVAQSVRYATRVGATVTDISTLAQLRPAANAQDRSTSATYDALNRVSQQTDAEGTVSQYTYDGVGNLIQTVRAVGTVDTRTLNARYDLQGRLTGELTGVGSALLNGYQSRAQVDAIWAQYGVSYSYDAAGRRTSSTDANGNRTLFFYNTDGNLTYTVNPLGEVSQTGYDAFGRVYLHTQYGTRINVAALTQAGATGGLETASLISAVGAVRNASLDSTVSYRLNLDGTVGLTFDAAGYIVDRAYDAFGDELSRTDTIGNSSTTTQAAIYDHRGLQTVHSSDTGSANATTHATYDAFGRLTSNIDANGNAHTQAYDRLGRMVSSTDGLVIGTSSSYDAFGRELTHTDALGHITRYAYDKTARSVTVTTPEGNAVSTVHSRQGQTVSITDALGNITRYAYDKNGNLLVTGTSLTTASSTYDRANRLTSTVDANGNVVALSYDAANRLLTRTVDPGGLNLVTSYQYDAKGQQLSVTNANGSVTQLVYDLKGQLIRQVIDPTGLNLITQYTYDGLGKTLSVTAPSGTVTQYNYDKLGRRTSEQVDPAELNLTRSYAYDKNGNVTSVTDANGNLTRYAYDADDRLVFTLDAAGDVSKTEYDAAGRISRTVAYATAVDLTGLSAAPTVAQLQARAQSSAADAVSNRVYDTDDRLVATVNGLGEVVKTSYDANGRVIEQIAYANRINLATWIAGSVPLPVADAAHDQRLRSVYDALGRSLYTIDGTGAVVAQTFDGNGNVVDRVAYSHAIAANAVATQANIAVAVAAIADPSTDAHVRRVYDTADRLSWSVNGVGAVTHQLYDRVGNLTLQVQYATAIAASAMPSSVLASTSDRIIAMTYDSANRQVFAVDAMGGVNQNVFDKNGNVTQQISYATRIAAPTAASVYTNAGIQAGLSLDAANDRVQRAAYDAANRAVLMIDATGAATELTLDGVGNALQTRRYATLVSTTGLSATATPADLRARLSSDAANDRISKQAFDADNRLVYSVDGLGYVQMSRYDALGRITSNTQYALAINASVASSVAAIGAAVVASTAADRSNSFSYDAQGRLLHSTDALGFSEGFSYDAVGNKLSYTNKKAAVWTYDYDAAGRMRRETSPQVALTTVVPDGSGNLAVWDAYSTPASVVTDLTYDALGNLRVRTEALGRPEQRSTVYIYDALGRQTMVIFPPVGVYDANVDNLTTNGASGLATRADVLRAGSNQLYSQITYDALGNAIANRDVGGNMSYKTYDGLGRVAYDVDAMGFVTGYTRNARGDVTRLARFAAATTLVNGSPTALSTAQVSNAVNAVGVDHGNDRALLTDYDRAGRAVQVVEPSAAFYAPDEADPLFQYGFAGKTTRNTYDAFGDLRQVALLNDQHVGSWNVINNYFDKRGQQTATVDALGYLTTQAFDGSGDITRSTQYANAIFAWNGSSPAATPVAAGSVNDRTVASAFDLDGRKLSESRLQVEVGTAVNGVTPRADLITRYSYDAVGNLTSTSNAATASESNVGVTYSYYDALGRVTAIAAPARASTVSGQVLTPLTAFRRDAYGNVVVTVNYARGASVANAAGYTAMTDTADRTSEQQYDALGHVVESTDADGVNHYDSYDAQGHLAKEWQAVSDGVTTKTLFRAYQYDKLGQQTQIIDPASTTVLQSGLATQVSSSVESVDESGATLSGTNSVGLSWSSLIDATGGLVRVQIDYQTQSTYLLGGTDESGNQTSSGIGSHSASRTQDFGAAAASAGATLSWNDSYSVDGGISHLDYIRVWQQDAAGNWVVKWQGSSAQANGSGVVTLTQAQAGVTRAASQYNAFGEVVRQGTDGGWQQYFDYDNAGHLWRTNSGDGVDKVMLYDLQGHSTALITSAGSGRDNINLHNYASADQVAALADVRRTDTHYDALGRVVQQVQAARLNTLGGVTVRPGYTHANIVSSTEVAGYDESGNVVGWAGTNSVSLSWTSLAALGSGDIKVEMSYSTRSYQTFAGAPGAIVIGQDESGNPIYGSDESGNYGSPITLGGDVRTRSEIVRADQAAAGVTFSWQDDGGTIGGVGSVTHLRVSKKDVNGNWQVVVDQSSFGASGSTIEVATPADPSTYLELQMRPAGSTSEAAWATASSMVNFGDAWRFDGSSLNNGSYEYRVRTSTGATALHVTSSGTLGLAPPVLAEISNSLSFTTASSGVYAWQSPGSAVTQVLRVRTAGSTGAWTTRTVTAVGSGYDGVNLNDLAAGSYDYELLWTHNGDAAAYAHATGQITVVAGVPPRSVAAVGLPPTAVSIVNGNSVSWSPVAGASISFRVRAAGGSWTNLTVNSVTTQVATPVTQLDESGNAVPVTDESGNIVYQYNNVVTSQNVNVAGLAAGNYDYELLITAAGHTTATSQATGQLTVYPQGAGHYETRTVSVQVPVTVTPVDPASYIIGWTGAGPTYSAPVVTGYDASGNPIFGQGYGRDVSYDESGTPIYGPVHAIAYTVYHAETHTETYPVQVVAGYDPVLQLDESGNAVTTPVYETRTGTHSVSYQFQTGQTPIYATDESGNIIYDTSYTTETRTRTVPVYETRYTARTESYQVQVQGPAIFLGYDESGTPIYQRDESGNLIYQVSYETRYRTVYDPYQVQVSTRQENYTAQVPVQTPEIIGYTPTYETRYRNETYTYQVQIGSAPVYARDESGNIVYTTRYATEYHTRDVQVQVPTVITPANPAQYVISSHSGTPIYGAPVVVGTDGAGHPIYGQGYSMVNGTVHATPYTVYQTQNQQQQVLVAGATPAPTLVDHTQAYQAAYTIAGVAAQYSAVNTSVASAAVSQTFAGTQMVQSAAMNGESTWLRPVINQKLDRWGNVLEVNDPRSADWITVYTYNANNQVTTQTQPDVNGASSAASPVTRIYYNAQGQQIAVTDADGHTNSQQYDAAGNLVADLHADGGVITYRYDAFGEKAQTTDALSAVTSYAYNKLGQLLQTTYGSANVYSVNAANQLVLVQTRPITETATYDTAGRKLTQTNGNGETIRYTYDLRGNIVRTQQAMGDATVDAYDVQGHKVAEVDANGYAATWNYDFFGELQAHTDIGGARYTYTYDNARQLTAQTNTRGQSISYSYDAAGQATRITDNALGQTTLYAYDASGNHIEEKTIQNGVVYQDNHLAYDALGRLRWVGDASANITIQYDAVGNRTRILTHVINGSAASTDTDRYFQYDAMNRQTVVDAIDAYGNLGADGHAITYDINGNRKTDTHQGTRVTAVAGSQYIAAYNTTSVYVNSDYTTSYTDESGNVITTNESGGHYETTTTPVYATSATTYQSSAGLTTERYNYDALNRLQTVIRDDTLVDTRLYDGAGRVLSTGSGNLPTAYVNALNGTDANGQTLAGDGTEKRINRYDADGKLLHQTVLKNDSSAKYDIDYTSYDAAGNLLAYTLTNHDTSHNQQAYTNTYHYTEARTEGYKEASITGTSSLLQPGTTTDHYDVNGNLTSISDSTQAQNNRSFVNDIAGRVLQVNQNGNIERQLVVNGEVLGSYGQSIDATTPRDANGNPNFVTSANFNFGYQPINGNYPSAAPGVYTVTASDTLASIAQGAYGDSSLWYRIADANGLSGNRDLRVGQALTIPNLVGTVSNNSTSFKPYDPSQIKGDTTPNLPAPAAQGGGGCGGLGQILVVIVAVVVAYFTAGAALGAMTTLLGDAAGTIAAGAIGGAVGSIASQAVGNVIGVQSGFSWKGVALGALAGAVAAGVGGVQTPNGPVGGIDGLTGSGWQTAALRGAITNATTQGIEVAIGLQDHFNWIGVAAASAGSAVGAQVGSSLQLSNAFSESGLGAFGVGVARGTVAGFAAGLTTSALQGGHVSVVQVATDAFGNALGQSLGEELYPTLGAYPAQQNGTPIQSSPLDDPLTRLKIFGLSDGNAVQLGQPSSGIKLGNTSASDAHGYESGGIDSRETYRDGVLIESAHWTNASNSQPPAFVDPETGVETFAIQNPRIEMRPLPPIPQSLTDRAAPNPSFGQTFMGAVGQTFSGIQDRLDEVGADPGTSDGLRFAAAMVSNPAKWFASAVVGTGAAVTYVADSAFRNQINDGVVKFLSNDPVGNVQSSITQYWSEHSALELARDGVNFVGGGMVGAPFGKVAGIAASETASVLGDAGQTALRWSQRLSEYQVELGSVNTTRWGSQTGAVASISFRDLRAELTQQLPEGFDIVRVGRSGTAILRYGDDTFYSVPQSQYSLIPELRTMDTMGDAFTNRVQSIADDFDPSILSRNQQLRLDATPSGWLKDKFTSAYKGSYIHGEFGDELKLIEGGTDYAYKTVGPDIVPRGSNGAGLKYEITQRTNSLNAIYSHTRKYTDELLRYVTYR